MVCNMRNACNIDECASIAPFFRCRCVIYNRACTSVAIQSSHAHALDNIYQEQPEQPCDDNNVR